MPAVDEQVMEFVEEVLEKEPEVHLEDLFNRTKEFKSSIGRLTKRQFNARYPLQVKRRRALATKGRKKASPRKRVGSRTSRKTASPPKKEASSRELVRGVLLEFATDITSAEERRDLVKVLARVDRYVDRIVSGVRKA